MSKVMDGLPNPEKLTMDRKVPKIKSVGPTPEPAPPNLSGSPTIEPAPPPTEIAPQVDVVQPGMTRGDQIVDPVPEQTKGDMSGTLAAPRYPVPVNIDYADPVIGGPSDTNPKDIIDQTNKEVATDYKRNTEGITKLVLDASDRAHSSSEKWYPETYFDPKQQIGDMDKWLKGYATGQAHIGESELNLGVGGIASWTNATENAIKARGNLSSRIGQELMDLATIDPDPNSPFNKYGVPAVQQKHSMMEGAQKFVDDKAKGLLGKDVGGLVSGAYKWITQSSPLAQVSSSIVDNYLHGKQVLNIPEETDQFKPWEGKFKQYGTGVEGGVMWLTQIPQNVLSGAIYDTADYLERLQGKPNVYKGSRVLESLTGTDYSFFNTKTPQRKLAIINPNEANPWTKAAQYGLGFGIDMITGGIADNLVAAGRIAKAEKGIANHLAIKPPSFLDGVKQQLNDLPPVTLPNFAKTNPVAVPSKIESIARAAAKTPDFDKTATIVQQQKILPKELSGASPEVIQQTSQFLQKNHDYTQAASASVKAQDEMLKLQEDMVELTQKLEEMPNVERGHMPTIEATMEANGLSHTTFQPKYPGEREAVQAKVDRGEFASTGHEELLRKRLAELSDSTQANPSVQPKQAPVETPREVVPSLSRAEMIQSHLGIKPVDRTGGTWIDANGAERIKYKVPTSEYLEEMRADGSLAQDLAYLDKNGVKYASEYEGVAKAGILRSKYGSKNTPEAKAAIAKEINDLPSEAFEGASTEQQSSLFNYAKNYQGTDPNISGLYRTWEEQPDYFDRLLNVERYTDEDAVDLFDMDRITKKLEEAGVSTEGTPGEIATRFQVYTDKLKAYRGDTELAKSWAESLIMHEDGSAIPYASAMRDPVETADFVPKPEPVKLTPEEEARVTWDSQEYSGKHPGNVVGKLRDTVEKDMYAKLEPTNIDKEFSTSLETFDEMPETGVFKGLQTKLPDEIKRVEELIDSFGIKLDYDDTKLTRPSFAGEAFVTAGEISVGNKLGNDLIKLHTLSHELAHFYESSFYFGAPTAVSEVMADSIGSLVTASLVKTPGQKDFVRSTHRSFVQNLQKRYEIPDAEMVVIEETYKKYKEFIERAADDIIERMKGKQETSFDDSEIFDAEKIAKIYSPEKYGNDLERFREVLAGFVEGLGTKWEQAIGNAQSIDELVEIRDRFLKYETSEVLPFNRVSYTPKETTHKNTKLTTLDRSNVVDLPSPPDVTPISNKPLLKASDGVSKMALPDELYHGSKVDVDDLSVINPLIGSSPSNELGSGIYFTNDKGLASQYAMASPQLNVPTTGANWLDDGNLYTVTPTIQSPIDASKTPPDTIKQIFSKAARDISPESASMFLGRVRNLPLEKYWTTFREVWAETHPGVPIAEDLMKQFNDRTASEIASHGFDAIFKRKGKSYVVNILKGEEDNLPFTQANKEALPYSSLDQAKMHRLRTDQWAEQYFGGTLTHKANTLQSTIELLQHHLDGATEQYIKNEMQAVESVQNLERAEEALNVASVADMRKKAIAIYDSMKQLHPDVPTASPRRTWNEGIFKPEDLDEVEKRVSLIMDRLEKSRQAREAFNQLEKDHASAIVQERFANAARFSHANKLNPGLNTRSTQYLLARNFAIYQNMGGLGTDLTAAGEVRQFMKRAQLLWEGGIHEALAQLEFLQTNDEAWKVVSQIGKKYNIPDNEWRIVTGLAEEIGWHRYFDDYMDVGPRGLAAMKERQERLMRTLNGYGLTDEDIVEVINQAGRVADVYHEVLAVGQSAGLDIGKVSGINYFPRIFSDEALKRFAWERVDEDNYKIFGSSGVKVPMYESFVKSRNSWNFVVEDEIVLDFLLRQADPEVYKTLGVDGVRDLIEDTGKLGEALFNHLGMDTVDRLIEMGLMSKIPMTGEEVYNHIMKKYPRLPFKGIKELMATDWDVAARAYKDQLENMAGMAGTTWATVRNAIDNKWGVTKFEHDSKPQEYKGFVPLSSAIPPSLANRFGVTGVGGFNDTFVHPVVAGLYRSLLDIETSPTKLGIIGQGIEKFNNVFRLLAISTPQFLTRQVFSRYVQTWAGGGNITQLLPTSIKMLAAHKVGLDKVLNNTRKMFKGLTELELYHEMVKRGAINNYTIFNGHHVNTGYSSWNPLNVEQTSRYIANAFQYDRGITEAGSMAHDLLNNKLGFPLRFIDNTLDNAAKFNLVKSLMSDSPVDRAIRATSAGSITSYNLEEAIYHASQYFFQNADLGEMDKNIGRYVVPFWTYKSRNFSAQIKNLMRNPSAFYAYNKLYAMQNAPLAREEDDFPVGGISKYMLEDQPLYWKTGDGEFFGLPMTGVDPIADVWNDNFQTGNSILRSLGIWKDHTKPRTPEGQLNELPWSGTKTADWFGKLFKDTYPIYKGIASTIKGENVDTGQKLDPNPEKPTSFLGIYTHPLARYWAENLFPTLGYINRINPNEMFGRAPVFNYKEGKLTNPGKPSVFGAMRSDQDRGVDQVSKYWWTKMLKEAGFNVQPIDVAFNMGYREDEVKYALLEGRKAIWKLNRNNPAISDPKIRQENEMRLGIMKAAWAKLQIDYVKFYNWRLKRNLKPAQGMKELQRQQLSIQNLPISKEEERKIYQELETGGN